MRKADRFHRRPGSELAHCFRGQRDWEGVDSRRDGIAATDADSSLEGGDTVDEGKGTEVLAHLVVRKTRIQVGEPTGAGVARCCRMTTLQKVSTVNSRGISANLSGDPKRSAGTSLKNARNL